MPEKETEVKTYSVDYVCDSCGKGRMIPTGVCYDMYPPLYPHYCSDCDKKGDFGYRYPRTVLKKIPNLKRKESEE